MHFRGDTFIGEWYFLLSVILAGVLCSLPSLILCDEKIKPFFIKIIIRFCTLFAAVWLLGWLFNWYSELMGYAIVMLIFIFVYIFVWLVTKWIYIKEDKEINNALNSIRDDE
jgi:cytochrome c biogenesis factor